MKTVGHRSILIALCTSRRAGEKMCLRMQGHLRLQGYLAVAKLYPSIDLDGSAKTGFYDQVRRVMVVFEPAVAKVLQISDQLVGIGEVDPKQLPVLM